MYIVVNMESVFTFPEMEEESKFPYKLGGYYYPEWHCVRNEKAQNSWTYYTVFEIHEADLEVVCDELYQAARAHKQEAIAVKVVAHPELSRTVGPRADKWTYDDSKIIIG